MNLRDLHSPQPLNDADFAAIRARVKSRIREPRALPLLFRLGFAMLLVVAFVPHVQHRAPSVPVVVKPVALATTSVASPVSVERRPLPAAGFPARARRPRAAAAPQETPAAAPPDVAPLPALARIEYQTADPQIRIIWIVNKESS
jgi:hypothetical protein